MSIRKIAVTGTKGKTTVVNFVAEVLKNIQETTVLHVNTTGHFVDGERKSTLDDSKRVWGLLPTVAPGRYLFEFYEQSREVDSIAVLETSLGCGRSPGMGYATHKVGVFLNVFEDHIGNNEYVNSQEDIVSLKSFVAKRIAKGGWYVLNADDPFVTQTRRIAEEKEGVHIFYITLHDIPDDVHYAITREGDDIVYYRGEEKHFLVNVHDVPWTFEGAFLPSVYNLMAVCASVISFYDGDIPYDLKRALTELRFDRWGGRLTRLRGKSGVEIIADYAHEKHSLSEVAKLAQSMCVEGGKVYGLIRIAHNRTEEMIVDAARTIAQFYDEFVVYDKIDGYYVVPEEKEFEPRFKKEVGRVSALLTGALVEAGATATQVIREDEAMEFLSTKVQSGDVVVSIVNDDIKQSIEFIQHYFAADFV